MATGSPERAGVRAGQADRSASSPPPTESARAPARLLGVWLVRPGLVELMPARARRAALRRSGVMRGAGLDGDPRPPSHPRRVRPPVLALDTLRNAEAGPRARLPQIRARGDITDQECARVKNLVLSGTRYSG